MTHKVLVRVWWLAAVLAGAVVGLPNTAHAGYKVMIRGAGQPSDIDRLYPEGGAWFDLFGGFQVAYFSPDGATKYADDVTTEDPNSQLWTDVLKKGATAILDSDVLPPPWDVIGKTGLDLEEKLPEYFKKEVEDSATFALVLPNGIVGVLHFQYVPLGAYPWELTPDPSASGPAPALIRFGTTRGCGASFTTDELVGVVAQLPVDGTIRITVGPRDAYGEYPLADSLPVAANQPVALTIPSNLSQLFPNYKSDFWRLRLYPVTKDGFKLSQRICNFSLTPPPPPGPYPVPQTIPGPTALIKGFSIDKGCGSVSLQRDDPEEVVIELSAAAQVTLSFYYDSGDGAAMGGTLYGPLACQPGASHMSLDVSPWGSGEFLPGTYTLTATAVAGGRTETAACGFRVISSQ